MKRIIAPALASLLAASAAGLALTPSGAAAQEGTTLMLVPQGGAVTPGQGYVLVPTPGPTGQYGQGFAQGTPLDLGREMFERGYWLGRYEEQLRQAQG